MRPSALLRFVAVAAYGAYFGLWVFGFVDVDRSRAPHLSRELFYGLTIGVPCFLVGAAIARWWAPAVGLVFVAFLPLGERCTESRESSDVVTTSCAGVADDLLLLLVLTTPCVLIGVIAVKLGAGWLGRSGRGGPGSDGATRAAKSATARVS